MSRAWDAGAIALVILPGVNQDAGLQLQQHRHVSGPQRRDVVWHRLRRRVTRVLPLLNRGPQLCLGGGQRHRLRPQLLARTASRRPAAACLRGRRLRLRAPLGLGPRLRLALGLRLRAALRGLRAFGIALLVRNLHFLEGVGISAFVRVVHQDQRAVRRLDVVRGGRHGDIQHMPPAGSSQIDALLRSLGCSVPTIPHRRHSAHIAVVHTSGLGATGA
mmetsp:Transcript_61860/g.174826  ORF Transcript_61860/g.174826 Transcript_61860/m.174826 type:complete len:218 (+) Transcript_61860:6-659(+)